MDIETIGKIFQSFAWGGAALTGTLWAIFRFLISRKKQAITISIIPSLMGRSREFPVHLLIKVIFKNTGDQVEIINIQKAQLCVTEITGFRFDSRDFSKVPLYAEPTYWKHHWPDRIYVSATIRPGTVFKLPFLVSIDHPGTYHIRFTCDSSSEVANWLERAHKKVVHQPGNAEWIGQTFLRIDPLGDNKIVEEKERAGLEPQI